MIDEFYCAPGLTPPMTTILINLELMTYRHTLCSLQSSIHIHQSFSRLYPERHRPVIGQADLHISPKTAAAHLGMAGLRLAQYVLK